MSRVVIERGRGRVYFDPATRFLRMDYNGAGPTMELTGEDLVRLSMALWYAAPIEARRAATTKIGAVHESGKSRPE